jgi:hypothetical protein
LGKFQWSSNGRFYGPTYVCMYIHSFTDRWGQFTSFTPKPNEKVLYQEINMMLIKSK